MSRIVLVAFFMFLGCAEENELYEPQSEKIEAEVQKEKERYVWVCHNPESEFHGGACVPECMERGNPYKFCWLKDTEEDE